MNFAHLHVHTDASLMDGLGTVDSLVERASDMGFKQLAITDHGTLTNSVAFSLTCKQFGIKPILGMEGYIEVDGRVGHITLLADGNRGWANLVKLNNLAQESDTKRPSFRVDDLIELNSGLICLTGCVASPLNSMEYDEAFKLAYKLKQAFGARLFAEMMFVGDSDTATRPLKLAKDLGLKAVLTNDVHFPLKSDAKLHPLLTSMKAGFQYGSQNLWLKSPQEIMDQVEKLKKLYSLPPKSVLDEAIANSLMIAERISAVDLKSEPRLPTIENSDELLVESSKDGLEALMESCHMTTEQREVYYERYNKEISVINSMNYSTYFMILKDIIDYAKSIGCKVGAGRGSGAGSLILYTLGITDVDPIKYGLWFERFLNLKREGMPDVDVDFDSRLRDQVITYAQEKWGGIQIATYSKYSHKSLVHDLAKMLKIGRETENRLAELPPESEAFQEFAEEHSTFAHAYERFVGQIRHKGKHAGGVVITSQDVPTVRASGKLVAAFVEGRRNELSHVGMVKFDLLGLSALAAIAEMERLTGKQAPPPPDGDCDEFSIFRDGKVSGIFQFSGSSGIRRLTMKIAPTTFKDIYAINALYRPGALDAGTADKYPEWKENPREIHPSVDPILKETYGVILYQEQVMQIFQAAMLGTLEDADIARRVIVKSKRSDPVWRKKFSEIQLQFIGGCMENLGMDRHSSELLWSEIATHSRYSFNKSHSVAYAFIAWQMAWFKYHFPVQFFTAMLNNDASKQGYIYECVSSGIDILPPHINTSSEKYETDGKSIFMPLTSVKFVSSKAVDAVKEARESEGLFKSKKDFRSRVAKRALTRRGVTGLWELNAFDGLEGTTDDLQLGRDYETPIRPAFETQKEWLDFIIPTKKFIQAIAKEKDKGWTAGIVSSIKNKKSRYGKYHTVQLKPEGFFWYRGDFIKLEVGDAISVKKKSNNKALKAKRIDL